MSIGAFIAVSFETRSLEVAVGGLAARLQDKGWVLIAVIMALFSLLGTTMGFSVETFGFYALPGSSPRSRSRSTSRWRS